MTKPGSPVGGTERCSIDSITASAGGSALTRATNCSTVLSSPSTSQNTPWASLPTSPARPISAASRCR